MVKSSISTKLLKTVFSIYFLLTLCVTIAQIAIEYYATEQDIRTELGQAQRIFEPGLVNAMWNMDAQQLQSLSDGIMQVPIILGLEITDLEGNTLQRVGITLASGPPQVYEDTGIFWHTFKLTKTVQAHTFELGEVKIFSNASVVLDRVALGYVILVINAIIKTCALWLLFLWAFNKLLKRPLTALSDHAEQIDIDNIQHNQAYIHAHGEAELAVLENTLNNMITRLASAMSQLNALNRDLEDKVAARTASLKQSLAALKSTQEQLIESEKMAALGTLVAGVSHEVNTPIGLSFTAITYFQDHLKKITQAFEHEQLDKSTFAQFIADAKIVADAIYLNLKKAAELVKSFKQVAVDQSTEQARDFFVKEYSENVLLSLKGMISKTNLEFRVVCANTLQVYSDPGAYSQVLTNLITNSINHGYTSNAVGQITITITLQGHDWVVTYTDDGKGIPKENLKRIFEPFFTTNRQTGGAGIGLHLLYNLVTQKLQGTVAVHSEVGTGTTFTLCLSQNLRTTPQASHQDKPSPP